MARSLPDKGPYADEFKDMPSPGEGRVWNAFPFDQKYMEDPAWYDQMGRSVLEQRRVFTRPRSGEEQVEMVKKALEDTERYARELDALEDVEWDEEHNAEQQDERVWSACIESAMKGSAAVMQYLVQERGLNAITAKRNYGMLVPLHLASDHGFVDVVEVLLEAGADINLEDNTVTSLSRAATGGHPELVKWLLDNGASYSVSQEAESTLFCSAALSGNVEVMDLCLAATREREPQKPTSEFLKGYVLGHAAQSASVEMFKLVLGQRGFGPASENTEEQRKDAIQAIPMCIRNNETNWTCLDTAIDCAILRDASGNSVRTDDEFFIEKVSTGITNAVTRGKQKEMNKLLQLILDATTMTLDSDRFKSILNEPINRCFDPKSKPCARDLLEKWGASPNMNDAADERNPWPLPLVPGAIACGDVEWVRFWLDHGADIHRAHGSYCNSQTALAFAVVQTSQGQVKTDAIVRELLGRGGPIDAMDSELVGKKQLYVVVYGSELNSVELTSVPVVEDKEDQETRVSITLEFPDGISDAWFENIQYRRPDAELAQDGIGRPRKGRRT